MMRLREEDEEEVGEAKKGHGGNCQVSMSMPSYGPVLGGYQNRHQTPAGYQGGSLNS